MYTNSCASSNRIRNRGFSLIELIVAVAIMSVLVGVLAPSLMHYVQKSKDRRCLYNMDVLREELFHRMVLEGSPDSDYAYTDIDDQYTCEGEKYSAVYLLDGKRINVFCSKHGWLETETLTEASLTRNLTAALKAFHTVDPEGQHLILKGTATGDKVEKELARMGITIDDNNPWQYWRYKDDPAEKGQLLIMDADIQKKKVNEKYYTLLFDGQKGKYTYRIGTVKSKDGVNYLDTGSNKELFNTKEEALEALRKDSQVLAINPDPYSKS